jgi:hypothetical protein
MEPKAVLGKFEFLERTVDTVLNTIIWEFLADGGDMSEEFLFQVPFDLRNPARHLRDNFLLRHRSTTEHVREQFAVVRSAAAREVGVHDMSMARSIGAGKELREAFTAACALHPAYSAMLLVLFDEGDIDRLVWQSLRPRDYFYPVMSVALPDETDEG